MRREDLSDVVNPTKLIRESHMAADVLTELDRAPLGDVRARRRVKELERQLLAELGSALSEPARKELMSLIVVPAEDAPSDEQLRLVQAQIVGWLEGLVDGMHLADWRREVEAEERMAAARTARREHGERR